MRRQVLALATVCTFLVMGFVSAKEPTGDAKSDRSQIDLGREIFQREWIANDPRSHGGDGLGPVFNASSCVDCHNQGGVGGGGAIGKNVLLLTVTRFKPVSAQPGVQPVQSSEFQELPVPPQQAANSFGSVCSGCQCMDSMRMDSHRGSLFER